MRSHPVVGSFFLVLGALLLAGGAFGTTATAPAPLRSLPFPPAIVIPFLLWQLATWAILFGIFFLRPRGRTPQRRLLARI